MPNYDKHLYMIVFPINALVSSQLEPQKFGEHYTTGSARHFNGKVIFAELDVNYRNDYFKIDEYLERTVPHEDGSPKKTKFISSYNVLEHVSLDSLKNLYLTTTNGVTLALEAEEFNKDIPQGILRLYQEITPLENFVASNLNQKEFGNYITRESVSKGSPKICFTQIDFDIEKFLEVNKNHDIIHIDLPNVNAFHFYDSVVELLDNPDKKTKTISLGSILRDLSYKVVRHGFWFVDGEKTKFYPMPALHELENKYYHWWKNVR
jgi:hypothetical protein